MKDFESMKMNKLDMFLCSTDLHLLGEGAGGFSKPFFRRPFMSFMSFMVNFPVFLNPIAGFRIMATFGHVLAGVGNGLRNG